VLFRSGLKYLKSKLVLFQGRMNVNISSISNRTLLGQLLRLPLKLIPKDYKIPVLQGKLKGKQWIVGSSNHGCWLGTYEYKKQQLFVKTIKKNKIVFDIGANVGFYTLLSSELVSSSGSVIAFEPLPENIVYLKEHVKLNCMKNVRIFEAAVSNHDGRDYFKSGKSRAVGHLASEGNMVVDVNSLDGFIKRNRLAPPDYLKIDVEGNEMNVLLGAKELLCDHKPGIFLDIHGIENDRLCCNLLKSMGYKLLLIDKKNKVKEIFASVKDRA
jgi:FkbM family methyltransferase